MNCTQIEKLLPLYVGDDLSAIELAQVRLHLAQCAACNEEAETFAATRNWMVSVTPAFDEDFYADLRHQVRNELVQQPSNTNWIWLGWLRPMPIISFVTLLLLASGLWLFQKKGAPVTDIVITPPEPQLPKRQLSPASPNLLLAQLHQRTRRALRSRSLIPVLPDLPQSEITLVVPTTLPLPAQADFTDNSETEVADALEMLRIEMQTADPNIRIIWLTPRTVEAEKD